MKLIMDEGQIARTLIRLSHEIIERHDDHNNLILIGIKTRGEAIANRIARNIQIIYGEKIKNYAFDFTPYRDDIIHNDAPKLPLEVNNKNIILIDDVIFEGRTIRAAMDGIMRTGRASTIEALALIDRGHRVLPIKSDYVGKNIPTSLDEEVAVHLKEYDGEDKVLLY